jgi:hypothetical protein
MIKYNIILDDENYVAPWDKFSASVSNSWDWEDDAKTLKCYKSFFDQAMIKEGMCPGLEDPDSYVTFSTPSNLSFFLLKWS